MKKEIIFITSRFPFPLNSGFANKNYWALRHLSELYDVHLIVVQHAKVLNVDLKRIESLCRTVKVFKPSIIDLIWGGFESLLYHRPFQIGLYHSFQLKSYLRKILPRMTGVFVSVVRSAQYVEHLRIPFVICFADSLGYSYLKDSSLYSGFKRAVYRIEGHRMISYERRIINLSSTSLFFNKLEASLLANSKIAIAPHGVSEVLFNIESPTPEYSDGIVFLGKMNFRPNVEAVFWFAKNVMPLVSKDVCLYVIGASPSPEIIALADNNPRIRILGFVEDPYPGILGSIASICPIQSGGGIQNKVLESLALGSPCISTLQGVSALPESDLSGVVVCESPEEWASAIELLRCDPLRKQSLGRLGKRYAREHFSWSKYSSLVVNALERSEHS